MLKASDKRETEDTVSYRIAGTTTQGAEINARIEYETDGREAWWDEDDDTCQNGGLTPGDEDNGWDEVLLAIDEYDKNS